jgi:Spy/CpxP family protein refolding chaperone
MKAGYFIIFSVSILILQSSFAWAQPSGPRGMGSGHGHPPCWLPDDLHLTPEQVEKLQSVQGIYLNDIRSLRNDLLNKRYELRRLMSDPASKGDDIRVKQEEVFVLEAQIQEMVIDYQLKVREILTPEQFRLWISRNQAGFGPGGSHRHGMGMRGR